MLLLKDRKAAELSEVGVMLALVVIAALAALELLGGNISSVLSGVAKALGGG